MLDLFGFSQTTYWTPISLLETVSDPDWLGAHPCGLFYLHGCFHMRYTASMQKNKQQKKQPSISLSHDSRGQYILINVFHYYAYVFIFLMMDLVRRKPCIFVDKAVRQHQAIKNYTSHACLHPKLNNISKTLSIQINHMICVWHTDKWRWDMTANKAD